MNVILEAIKFNHDTDSATGEAFNIRRNETEVVTAPEWRRGISVTAAQSPAAYAIAATRGNVLTIKAQFTGTANGTVRVRAIEARSDHHQVRGCNPIGARLAAFLSVRSARSGNVLGEVKEREIEFDTAGQTGFETFELHHVRIWNTGIKVSNTEWRWQFRARRGDDWTDFALTRHRIYTVLDIPGCPWEQTPHDDGNTQLPWADALEYTCDWADGARSPDDAASLVTQNIYDLGSSGVTYSGSSLYSCPNFNCTQFLDLLGGGTGAGWQMNCSDCATAVSSLANLVGCNLRQLQLGPCSFHTKPIKLLGFPQEMPDEFFGHEVAWKGSVNEDGQLFDACLQVDGDDQPEAPPFVALLPSNIPFGRTGEKHYRFRLSLDLILLPDTLGCRKIGFSVEGDCGQLDPGCLEFLKLRYRYADWSDPPTKKYLLSVDLSLFEQTLRSEWILKQPVQQPKFAGSVKAFQALALFPMDREVLLRLDLVEWKTSQEAREFMLRELGEFRLLSRVKRLTNPPIGDVSFVERGALSVLFARSQFVFLVRSVGRKDMPVTETAMRLDKLLVETSSANATGGNVSDTQVTISKNAVKSSERQDRTEAE